MSDNVRAGVLAFALTLLLLLAAFSGYRVWTISHSDMTAHAVYEEMQSEFHVPDPGEGDVKPDWNLLKKQYPGIVGWLSCPGTRLNYPIMQSSDNSYYLTHLADGTEDRHGAVFLDYRNTRLAASHAIVYGHNMNDGSMFHSLLNWGSVEYAADHPCLYLSTPEQEYVVWLYNACVVDPADSEVFNLNCGGDKGGWLTRCAAQSWFTADFVPGAEEPIITFSTCADHTKRFIVQGVVRAL